MRWLSWYVVAITVFGSRFARFQRTTGDYFLTGHTVPWWAICFTVVATETSTLTFIGVPGAAYAGNMAFLQLAAGYAACRIIVSALFLPAYFRGEAGHVVSAPAAALRDSRQDCRGGTLPRDPSAWPTASGCLRRHS